MENYYLFVFMSILLVLLPGPDTAIATKNTIMYGRIEGLKTSSGTITAILIHTLAAVVGISAIIVKSALIFSVIKYIGAVYLVYLGIKALWSLTQKQGFESTSNFDEQKKMNVHCFRQGFFTNLLNPKIAVFFLTFLPQFVDPSHTVIPQFIFLGVTYSVLAAIWYFVYVVLINKLYLFMRKASTQRAIEGLTGVVLIGFGIRLAFEKAH
ncbi:LysE family translocator [Aquibacillus albus]|uniref:RhtB (Resistance to homoserine/threonine) family protein n=1 Tax=Aquibacillus albus TaxID=1168171 RepID=A0ABS2N0F5_9BACI|nr:LysE family translocator [Aquibacillus albus]MBM7571585.1 RhtB (resistance to homoserine/threonine) family protein [Aquibacillus albus]